MSISSVKGGGSLKAGRRPNRRSRGRYGLGPGRIKRIGFGFHNFENYRIRVLLYAGKPNWRVLGSIVVR
jgi:hypothetical protein